MKKIYLIVWIMAMLSIITLAIQDHALRAENALLKGVLDKQYDVYDVVQDCRTG